MAPIPPTTAGCMQEVAILAKALADENRLRIIQTLIAGPKAVSQMVEELGISQPLASHHLKELKRALLVSVERRGPFIYYELADPIIAEIVAALNGLAVDLLTKRTTFYSSAQKKGGDDDDSRNY